MALTREYELAAVRCAVKWHYTIGAERAQARLEGLIRSWAQRSMPADADAVHEAVKAELSRRPYTIVQRRYGQFYGVDYESASVGLTLYVDDDPDKAEAMYHKLDAMTPEQMKSYIETR